MLNFAASKPRVKGGTGPPVPPDPHLGNIGILVQRRICEKPWSCKNRFERDSFHYLNHLNPFLKEFLELLFVVMDHLTLNTYQ